MLTPERRQQLEELQRKQVVLLGELQEVLIYEGNPVRRGELNLQIEKVKAQIAATKREIENLVASPSKSEPMVMPAPGELRQMLTNKYSLEELRDLCQDLGVDYENLPGEGKSAKARELIAHLQRRDRLPELLQVLNSRKS